MIINQYAKDIIACKRKTNVSTTIILSAQNEIHSAEDVCACLLACYHLHQHVTLQTIQFRSDCYSIVSVCEHGHWTSLHVKFITPSMHGKSEGIPLLDVLLLKTCWEWKYTKENDHDFACSTNWVPFFIVDKKKIKRKLCSNKTKTNQHHLLSFSIVNCHPSRIILKRQKLPV